MKIDIEASLAELASILRTIEEKLAWGRLALAEQRPGGAPSFQVQTRVREELRREVPILSERFRKLALDVNERLQQGERRAPEQVAAYLRRLEEIEREFRQLGIEERFVTL